DDQRGPQPMVRASVLLAAVLVVCVASDAQARRRHHGYWGGYESGERSSSHSSLDAWRRARDAQGQDQDQNQNQGQTRGQDRGEDRGQTGAQSPNQSVGPGRASDRNLGQDLRRERWSYRSRYERRRGRNLEDWRRAQENGQASGQGNARESGRASADVPRSRDEWRRARADARRARARAPFAAPGAGAAALSRGRSGPFGATVEKLVRGCAVQAAEFENWPFDSISEAVAPNEAQRNALTNLRNAANESGQRLAKDCPQEGPAAPAARLEAVEQGIDAALKAFDVVEPALQAFYSALN